MKYRLFITLVLVSVSLLGVSQVKTASSRLQALSEKYRQEATQAKQQAIEYARINNIPLRIENDSMTMELMYIDERGNPQYNMTTNAVAAATSSTNEVYAGGAAGLSLDGSGITFCEWDAGNVRTSHQEFGSRVTNMDGTTVSSHSTHVAGTMVAAGLNTDAKGMAFAANLHSYNWDYDYAEMATEASEGNLLSNHSYSWLRGWNGSTWWGDPTISTEEDYNFGFYDNTARNWDEIAVNAPYYLIVKSAGNDRGDAGDGSHPPDGPYDCIPQRGIAKNILTVGAVNDIPTGYSAPGQVVLAGFSSCGPADDGRIKPDIVANGIGLTSTYNTADDAYASLSGTSMSAPATTGSLALLVQHYENINGTGAHMRSATLKALVLHTADESGDSIGPDYQFGWGLLNTLKAANKITEDQTTDVISEHLLANGATFTREITTTGTSPIRVTIVWTDPPGNPPAPALDPPDAMLINDLNLRISQGTNTYYPWKLDKDNPGNAATNNSENNVDNVEMVDIASPASGTTYTITVDHNGTLASPQAFSMIISGDIDNAVAPTADFYADNTQPTTKQTVSFIDASINNPTSHTWSFSPATVTYVNGTSSTSKSPEVVFNEVGYYEVSLSVSNTNGSNVNTKTDYISVVADPVNYCGGFSLSPYGLISRVQLGTIDNPSLYTDVGGASGMLCYEDFTALVADVTIGESTSITVTNYYSDSHLDLAIWADWNRDGDFEDLDEQVVCVANNGGHGTFSINVPTHAHLGNTCLRIRTKWDDPYGCLPCGTTYEGEVEDYTLNVLKNIGWLGITNDWDDPANWSEGVVPNGHYKVTIPSTTGGVLAPIVSEFTMARCHSLTLQNGATLEVNGTLEVEN